MTLALALLQKLMIGKGPGSGYEAFRCCSCALQLSTATEHGN
jgi:hypothetical protein